MARQIVESFRNYINRDLSEILKSFSKYIDHDLSKVICIFLLYKISFLIIVYFSFNMLPFSVGHFNANLHYPKNEPVTFLTTLKTWDGQHYHYLSDIGYGHNQMSNAFYPLFPLLISVVSKILYIPNVIAGLVLSNIFSFGSVIFLFLLALQFGTKENAFRAVILYLAYPVTFYTNIMYTESLFLFLSIGFFYAIYKRNIILAIITIFLLPLSRPQGFLIIPIFFVFYILQYKKEFINIYKKREIAILISFVLGACSYFFYMYQQTGNMFSGFQAQNLFIAKNSILNIFRLQDWFIKNFINIDLAFHGFTNSILDRSFFLFYIIMLILIYKKMDLTLFSYSLIMGLIPALSGTFFAYSRYTLLVFPLFIALSLVHQKYFYIITVVFASMQSVFMIRHTLNYWMA